MIDTRDLMLRKAGYDFQMILLALSGRAVAVPGLAFFELCYRNTVLHYVTVTINGSGESIRVALHHASLIPLLHRQIAETGPFSPVAHP